MYVVYTEDSLCPSWDWRTEISGLRVCTHTVCTPNRLANSAVDLRPSQKQHAAGF